MSFSNDVKIEIVSNKPLRLRYKKAQAYGLFLYAKSFSIDEISFHTESSEIADLYLWFISSFVGRDANINFKQHSRRGKMLYTIGLPSLNDRENLMQIFGHTCEDISHDILPTLECAHAFLAGAWLACGNVTDPQKGYHLEFVVKNPALCDPLRQLLNLHTSGVGHSMRRGSDVLYLKECGAIEDLLTLIGASKSSLAMIEIEIVKEVRNKANRITNCETANIDKIVDAAAVQIEDIQFLIDTLGLDGLPNNLHDTAKLRMDHPDLSLRELALESRYPISRSGMHHRLDKLSKLAASIREKGSFNV